MGSFSTIYSVEEKTSNKKYAIKAYNKTRVKNNKDRMNISIELKCLQLVNGLNFFVKMVEYFENKEFFYIVMNLAENGNLSSLIKMRNKFNNECVRFYSAQILLALEHIHRLGIIHRDIKPENFLLDEKMNIQLTDFGSSFIMNDQHVKNIKSLENNEKLTYDHELCNRLIGSAQYVSPEMLTDRNVTFSNDLWAFGVMVYQMIAGSTPFFARTEYLIFKKIKSIDINYNEDFDTISRNFIMKILKLNPSERLGAKDDIGFNGYFSIKNDNFFKLYQTNWSKIHQMKSPIY